MNFIRFSLARSSGHVSPEYVSDSVSLLRFRNPFGIFLGYQVPLAIAIERYQPLYLDLYLNPTWKFQFHQRIDGF